MIYRVILFLILNFTGLAIGGLFTGEGVSSEWYTNINKAPWTPPGWVFGTAWTTIMVCFSFYLAYLYPIVNNKKKIISLYAFQWLLNVGWNPVFFYYQNVILGLLVIVSITILIGIFTIKFWPRLKLKSILILPYLIWIMIATSLNGYIYFYN